jgi:hypothetical protein
MRVMMNTEFDGLVRQKDPEEESAKKQSRRKSK